MIYIIEQVILVEEIEKIARTGGDSGVYVEKIEITIVTSSTERISRETVVVEE